ncbi:hypothetical protein [Helicovermis profundi]|uniref:Uncharacterized protein n=1 Tax=Helicovermis profundi TaxID=3065157 RepID=A0AAU9E2X3_9FIRM|nr:hypothetical protein HLPR_11570 [Clostridia bacterium S502]
MDDGNRIYEMALKSFEQFQENQMEIVKSISEIKERIIITEESTKSAHRKLNSQEEQTKTIIKMSTSIEYIAKQIEDALGAIKVHDGKFVTLEKAPGDNILGYWKLFIGGLIAGGTGLLIGLIMKGGMQ